jgi:hypothetical protein
MFQTAVQLASDGCQSSCSNTANFKNLLVAAPLHGLTAAWIGFFEPPMSVGMLPASAEGAKSPLLAASQDFASCCLAALQLYHEVLNLLKFREAPSVAQTGL